MPELRTVAACTVSGRIHPYRVRLRPISAHGRDRHVPLSYTAGVVVLATVHGREAFLLELYTVTALQQRVYTVGTRFCQNCTRCQRVHFRNERIPTVYGYNPLLYTVGSHPCRNCTR